MEVIGETPPPLPPKTKKPFYYHLEDGNKKNNSNGFYKMTSNENGFEFVPPKVGGPRCHQENNSTPLQSFQMPSIKITELQLKNTSADEIVSKKKNESEIRKEQSESSGPRIITWATKAEKNSTSDSLYENVGSGVKYVNTVEKKRKTPKIEVRQEENKTVVKISIKESPSPEEEMEGGRSPFFKDNFYENGYQGKNGFSVREVYENCDVNTAGGLIYENANVQAEDERCYENLSSGCYENVTEDRLYANVNESVGFGNRSSKKELITEANYCNLNCNDSECDQVYNKRELQVFKNSGGSVTSKNLSLEAKKSPEHEDKGDELYENVDCHTYVNENLYQNAQQKWNETAEKNESRKTSETETTTKSSTVELFLQKPAAVKVEKSESESPEMSNLDDGSSGDPFDSGTCSDVDSLPTLAQPLKKGNVVVTIKTLQNEDKNEDLKKNESGHKRAESLTSSGVGVDSEESDDEKSNISCDSLNSNEPYPQSNSEDHGYHTPNSEDKTGSPIERIDYEKVLEATTQRDFEENPDIIQQVADVTDKIKNLRTDNCGIFSAKLIEPSEFEEYENVHVFELSKVFKKKPAPPPPPPKASLVTLQTLSEDDCDDSSKKLPTNLLHDIRSRNVRLSSTYPSGEKPEGAKKTIAIPTLDGNSSEKQEQSTTNDPKKLMVEERTYEERKTAFKSVKVNKICAMEIDTDKFYKFHLTENVRENGKDGDNGNDEETFAGIKDYLSREKPAAITSAKGTIRGVKNRVKAGIATFLQLQQNKTYKDKDAGKVVVYTTTMGIVRETYHKCLKVKQILKTLMVKFEERDVFMSSEAQEEIRERMNCDAILVPQVFVEGQHIGDAETIERLNEVGELRTILKPYKSADVCSTCKVCGGYRLLPCSVCKGSKKSIHRNHFTAEFVSLKCMNCDQVGLTKCHAC